eukprot:g44947.t1
MPKKSIRVFPNREPWMNRGIHCLLKTRHVAFMLDNPDLYRKSRYDLLKAIRDAERQYQTKLETQSNHTDTRCLWQGLHNITGHKMKQSKVEDKNTSFPDAFNAFYAQFRKEEGGHAPISITNNLSWISHVDAMVKKELVSLVVSELAEEEDVLFSVENAGWQNSHRAARPLFLEIGWLAAVPAVAITSSGTACHLIC